MDVETVDYYGACDRAIQAMNRSNLEAFGQLKMAKWDQLNVIQTVKKVYRKSEKQARQRYYEVAFEAYLLMLALCGMDPKKAHRMAEETITEAWVDDVLSQTDFVTLYRFDTEAERKAYRLAEALEVSQDKSFEVDKALRFWSQQLGQYAINMTDYAMLAAMDDAKVTWVRWVTMRDERVCNDCRPLDGQVFRLEEVPPKHWGCRCRLAPVFRSRDDREVEQATA